MGVFVEMLITQTQKLCMLCLSVTTLDGNDRLKNRIEITSHSVPMELMFKESTKNFYGYSYLKREEFSCFGSSGLLSYQLRGKIIQQRMMMFGGIEFETPKSFM